MIELARAKINLFLHVGDRRADNFHPLQSLVVFTELGDQLAAQAGEGLSLQLQGPFAAGLAAEPDNLVLRAGKALAEAAGVPARAQLTLTKNLPVASGIGGGSADAAAALRTLAALWRVDLPRARVAEIAASLGSDVPVCLASEPAFMEGRGEILKPVQSMPRLPLLLVNPRVAVPTKDVFAALQTRSGTAMALPQGRFRDSADLLRLLEATSNDLEAPAQKLQPAIGAVLKGLAALPGALFARMSGSGATCFALFADDAPAARGGETLRQSHPDWWIAPTFVPEFNIAHDEVGQDIGPTDRGL